MVPFRPNLAFGLNEGTIIALDKLTSEEVAQILKQLIDNHVAKEICIPGQKCSSP